MAKERPKFRPRRRRMFECEECGELFVDEESLETHRHSAHLQSSSPEGSSAPAAQGAKKKKFQSPLRKRLKKIRESDDAEAGESGETIQDEQLLLDEQELSGEEVPCTEDKVEKKNNFLLSLLELGSDFGRFLRELVLWGLEESKRLNRECLLPSLWMGLRYCVVLILAGIVLLIGMGIGKFVFRLYTGPHIIEGEAKNNRLRFSSPIPVSLSGSAKETVNDFYHAVKVGSFRRAYSWLSPSWRKELPYEEFERGYEGTAHVKYRVDKIKYLSPKRARVWVDLTVEENAAWKHYRVRHILIRTAEGWKLDGGEVESIR